jgi:hypothetical protein
MLTTFANMLTPVFANYVYIGGGLVTLLIVVVVVVVFLLRRV